MEPYIRLGSRSPSAKEHFFGMGGGRPIAVSCAKTAELIEMPFGLWTLDPSNRLATIDMGRKVGGCCAPFRGESWFPI